MSYYRSQPGGNGKWKQENGVWKQHWKKSNPSKKIVKKKEPCHEGNVHVFDIGNVHIFGGGQSRGYQPFTVDIVIDTLGTLGNGFPSRTAEMFPDLADLWPIVIPMKTRDGNAPNWIKAEWQALVRGLQEIDEPKDLLAFCVGGHGRTGTVLSVLLGLTHPEYGDPVKWIREHYCKEAVERDAQLDYIEEMTGLETEESASKIYTSYSSSSSLPSLFDLIFPDDPAYDKKGWKDSSTKKGYQFLWWDNKQHYRIPPKDLGNKPKGNWISTYVQGGTWEDSDTYEGWEVNIKMRAYRKKGFTGGQSTQSEDCSVGNLPPENKILASNVTWINSDWEPSESYPGYEYSDTLGMYREAR